MSYCIALHSDIETLKIISNKMESIGYKWYGKGLDMGCDYMMFDKDGFTFLTNSYTPDYEHSDETITCTTDNLHETIDLIIEKLKEK